MNIVGHRVLVRGVLSAMPTFALTVRRAPKKLFKDIDKARRRFLWAHDGEISGGKCKVGWKMVTRPERAGGLGIHDLSAFARALRLRWLWLAWTQPNRPWVGSGVPCNDDDEALFAACTVVTINDGATTSFWSSNWLDGRPLRAVYPEVFAQSIRKCRTVRDTLQQDRAGRSAPGPLGSRPSPQQLLQHHPPGASTGQAAARCRNHPGWGHGGHDQMDTMQLRSILSALRI